MYEQLSTLSQEQMNLIQTIGKEVTENIYEMSKNEYRNNFNFPCYMFDKATKTSTIKEMFNGSCITIHIRN